jgi:hypothetical protein
LPSSKVVSTRASVCDDRICEMPPVAGTCGLRHPHHPRSGGISIGTNTAVSEALRWFQANRELLQQGCLTAQPSSVVMVTRTPAANGDATSVLPGFTCDWDVELRHVEKNLRARSVWRIPVSTPISTSAPRIWLWTTSTSTYLSTRGLPLSGGLVRQGPPAAWWRCFRARPLRPGPRRPDRTSPARRGRAPGPPRAGTTTPRAG